MEFKFINVDEKSREGLLKLVEGLDEQKGAEILTNIDAKFGEVAAVVKEKEALDAKIREYSQRDEKAKLDAEAKVKEFADFLNGDGGKNIKRLFANAENAQEIAAEIEKQGLSKDLATAKYLAALGEKFEFSNGREPNEPPVNNLKKVEDMTLAEAFFPQGLK
jgi:hypothetical protein